MKTLLRLTLFLFISSLVLSSCKKDEDEVVVPTPVPPTKSEMLVGTWDIAGFTVSPPIPINGTLITDWYAQLGSCNQDDTETYKQDKSYSWEEGLTKCNPNDPQVVDAGTWAFNSDETLLLVTTVATGTGEATIKKLTEVKMELTTVDIINGISYTFTGFYTKK